MLNSIFIFLVAAALTYGYGVFKKKSNKGKDKPLLRVKGYHLHNSLWGILLMLLPLFEIDIVWFFIGLGIVVGHGFEEVQFGKKNLKTFLTFISK